MIFGKFRRALLIPALTLSFSLTGLGGFWSELFSGGGKDWQDICASGQLRVLTLESPELDSLPRDTRSSELEMALLEKFAAQNKLKLVIVSKDNFDELLPALESGGGDIVSANVTVTDERRKKHAFTSPLLETRECVITNSANSAKTASDLAGKLMLVEKGSCYWENAEKLKNKFPGLELQAAPEGVDTDRIINDVADGVAAFAMADKNMVDAFLKHRSGVKIIHEFPEKRYIAWAVRKDAGGLVSTLNKFLKAEAAKGLSNESQPRDLPRIQDKRVLRMITRNNYSNYFIHKGSLAGFEYELASEFAKKQGLRLQVIVPESSGDMIKYLLEGKGDFIAASLSATEKRKALGGISFCEPYTSVRLNIVARAGDTKIKKLSDLAGRTVAVRKSSSYFEALEKLRNSGLNFYIVLAPENLETVQIMEKVASGDYDLTVADDIIIRTAFGLKNKIKAAFQIGEPERYAWIVRNSDTELKKAVDEFFRKEYRGQSYNILWNRYFNNSEQDSSVRPVFASRDGLVISPYDGIIKKRSGENDLHWCQVASQIYQESRFNPSVKAWDGGMGLMQLMPATAAKMKCSDPFNPDSNVKAGAAYLETLRKRFDAASISPEDQLCFALASYNGGYGHVSDARQLASELKLNPNKWFNNVEAAYNLLSAPQYAAKAKYGYCQAHITIKYVREIMLRRDHYIAENGRLITAYSDSAQAQTPAAKTAKTTAAAKTAKTTKTAAAQRPGKNTVSEKIAASAAKNKNAGYSKL